MRQSVGVSSHVGHRQLPESCAATLDRYSSDPHQEISALGRIVDALGPNLRVVSINGGSTLLVESLCEYLGSGYRKSLIEYPLFDLQLHGGENF